MEPSLIIMKLLQLVETLEFGIEQEHISVYEALKGFDCLYSSKSMLQVLKTFLKYRENGRGEHPVLFDGIPTL